MNRVIERGEKYASDNVILYYLCNYDFSHLIFSLYSDKKGKDINVLDNSFCWCVDSNYI